MDVSLLGSLSLLGSNQDHIVGGDRMSARRRVDEADLVHVIGKATRGVSGNTR